jgi:hypothetical protein
MCKKTSEKKLQKGKKKLSNVKKLKVVTGGCSRSRTTKCRWCRVQEKMFEVCGKRGKKQKKTEHSVTCVRL